MNEEDIPIDIHYNKLLDWLISRHHCKQQWQANALSIREKINNAIQDMPEHPEITALLKGTYINYFHCLRIVEILRETEADTKNFFGRYSSQRMKDWLEIVKLYQEEGTYLGEVAQMLIRNVNYELPALKKQISKCKQAQTDCSRKEGEYANNSSELKEKYHSQCKHMGIEGKKIKTELVSLVRDLPSSFENVAQSTKDLKPAMEYYKAFISFLLKREDAECLPILQYVIEKGNTTTYEYRTGKVPSSIDETQLNFSFGDEEVDESKTEEIDWGGDGIDFGDGAGDTIDFGDGGDGGDIDWGGGADIAIDVVDDSMGNVTAEASEGVARGQDALTVLDNVELRNNFLNELMELDAFLTQRLQELGASDDIVAGNQFSSAPEAIQLSTEVVTGLSGQVNQLLATLTAGTMKELMLIRSSPRYVDRLAEKLKKILSDSEKMMSLSRLMVTRREESRLEEVDTEPKLDLIRERTMELKKQIEKELSEKYKGRRVNIMGEVNTV